MKTTIIVAIISLIIGGSVGYYSGKGPTENVDQTKKLQDSITMMKEQSSSIKTMAEMMKSNGLSLQETGTKYKDEEIVSMGKDMEMVGIKYIEENTKSIESDTSMKADMD